MGIGERIHHAAGRLHGRGARARTEAGGFEQFKGEASGHRVTASLKHAGERVRAAFRRH